jgi:hypothetical protein
LDDKNKKKEKPRTTYTSELRRRNLSVAKDYFWVQKYKKNSIIERNILILTLLSCLGKRLHRRRAIAVPLRKGTQNLRKMA